MTDRIDFPPTSLEFALLQIKTALDTCIARGRVTDEELKIIAFLPHLGDKVPPPVPRADHTPLTVKGCKAKPGSWEQYLEVCGQAKDDEWDLTELAAQANRNDHARIRKNFLTYVLNAMLRAVVAQLRKICDIPELRPHLTPNRLCGIMQQAIERNEDEGQPLETAVENAARWALRSVITHELRLGRITPEESLMLVHEVWEVIRLEAEDDQQDCFDGEDLIARLRAEFGLRFLRQERAA